MSDTSVQLTWGSLPAGEVSAWAGSIHTEVDHHGGPGSLLLGDLEPARSLRIDITYPGGRAQLNAATLPSPPGELLCRIATISDLHLGDKSWGASNMMTDRSGHPDPFPVRCARAAMAEAVEWGAELIVIKGDAVHHQHDEHFALLADVVDGIDAEVLLIPGNHDVDGRGRGPLPKKVGRRGVPYTRGATCVDLPGLRVIVGDTTIPGQGPGSIEPVAAEITELAAISPGPALVAIHHQLQRYRVPTHYPSGISSPESTAFLDQLAVANPATLVTSGHTHRNRRRDHGPLVVTEVASTRDWPGVWAGYAVHEGGIGQLVRRAAAADAIGWHEYSRRALLGLWGWWAAGPLQQRCFTHLWPRR